jgi:putative peptide zinc metalloprotease protein
VTLAPERPVDDRPVLGCPRRRHPATTSSRQVRDDRPPRLADGVQLLGTYAGTGYEQEQYLARRPGGQLVQLSELLHLVAEACDGTRTPEQVAEQVSRSYGRTVTADNVRTLVDKLRPLGVLAAADGSSPRVEETDPLLGLSLRRQLLGPPTVRRVAALARPLFWPPLVAAVVAGLVAVDVWLFFVHGVGDGLRATVQQPVVFLLVAAVVVLSAALHELGHAAACAYGGAKPGGMGAGIYVVWPAFYTDVTEAYQLDRRGRLRTDLGGIYVNAMIVLACAGAYAVTRYEPLVLLSFLLQVQVLQQLLPFLRLDGYYVVSDLVGVPDLFRRIGPVLRSYVPFRPVEREVAELKPWVRRVVAGWVFVLVPVLALNLGYFVLAAPRIVATSWDSAARFVGQMTTAGGLTAVFAGVQLLLLLLPAAGITYTVVRTARRAAGGAWRWSRGSAGRRAVVLLAGLALAAGLAAAWWPDGRVTPYREGERSTVQQQVRSISTVGAGTPLLRSPQEAQQPLPPAVEPAGDTTTGESAPAEQEATPTTAPATTPSATPSPSSASAAPTASPSASPTAVASADPEPSAGTSGAATSAPTTSEPTTSGSTPTPAPTSSE